MRNKLVVLAAVMTAFLLPASAIAAVPYKKYGTLMRTMKDYAPPSPYAASGYYNMYWHYKGSFPPLGKGEFIGYHGYYEGSRSGCWNFAGAGDMNNRRLTDPHMLQITTPGDTYKHTFCVGSWYGLAQVYKMSRSGNQANPVLTIATFKFNVDK